MAHEKPLAMHSISDKVQCGPFEPVPLILQKGYYRRQAILENLSIGEVSNKVCLDFGTGGKGFAAIFPRLHACKFAYGFDTVQSAVNQSAEHSRSTAYPYGSRVEYLLSNGLELPPSRCQRRHRLQRRVSEHAQVSQPLFA